MLAAMLAAPTGDDVFGEDPTVNHLQERLADLFGQEAGLFCPSGTMTNQIAINVHTRPGDEVICDRLSHIYNYEGGGIARNSGVSVRLLSGDRGRFTVEQVSSEINPPDSHYARTSLVSIEDTCNKAGGSCYAIDSIQRIAEFTRQKQLGFHLDGARVFNALTHTGADSQSYGRNFDSISVCLSKGLGTPAGSVLLGTRSFIKEAHRVRKVMGGGMRQVGILAAAGLHALDERLPRLKEDHEKASYIASTLTHFTWVSSIAPVETNIVIAQLTEGLNSTHMCALLNEVGVRVLPFGPDKIRFVTHFDIHMEDLASLPERLEKLNAMLV
jgi:threonine aldolase